MTYLAKLSDDGYLGNCPQWYKNIWNACTNNHEIAAELLKFNGVYKMKTLTRSSDVHSICPEVSSKHYVEFNSEQDYLLCLLSWS